MPVFVKDDVSVLFVHVPKTGGSAIEDAFAEAGWDTHLLDRTSARHPSRRFRRCSPQHLHAELLEQLVRLERIDAVLVVVREPLARFRSEFLWRHRDEPVDAAAVSRWGRRMVVKYAEDPYVRDNHIRPQSQFLLPGALVHQYENGLQPALDDLAHRLGVDAPRVLPREAGAGRPRSSEVPVEGDLERLLVDFYADDFTRLGYPRGEA